MCLCIVCKVSLSGGKTLKIELIDIEFQFYVEIA